LVVWLSADGNCSQDVHHKVYPKHLDNVERSVAYGGSTKDSNDAENKIDRQLELDEFTNVVKDSSAPFNGFED
jgi:hypothetical protein